jgi:hypothetical protein
MKLQREPSRREGVGERPANFLRGRLRRDDGLEALLGISGRLPVVLCLQLDGRELVEPSRLGEMSWCEERVIVRVRLCEGRIETAQLGSAIGCRTSRPCKTQSGKGEDEAAKEPAPEHDRRRLGIHGFVLRHVRDERSKRHTKSYSRMQVNACRLN